MENFNPSFDAYIAKAADFAKPVLTHLRLLIHQACPGVEEKLKWGHPFFDYNGPICQIAAFKQHLGFGFWKARLLSDPHKVLKLDDAEPAAGNLGRISSLTDLPADSILIAYIQEAVQLNKDGVKLAPRPKPAAEKKEAVMPPEFADMLAGNADAQAHFEKFSPSKKKEYIEWVVDAKTEATRQKRMVQALEWISEGKSRNWKYQ